nr:MAG TPA: Protein of unknown function (DUF2829) [Caudoviricetes sp.]
MKTWEALKAADEGKKIRRKWRVKGMYSIKKEKACFDETALVTCVPGRGYEPVDHVADLSWDDIFADDWEIYKEEE